jgi:hypothetical protein
MLARKRQCQIPEDQEIHLLSPRLVSSAIGALEHELKIRNRERKIEGDVFAARVIEGQIAPQEIQMSIKPSLNCQ